MPITTDGRGHVALVKMERPDAMNSLDRAHNHALAEALLALAAADEVRCVVVTGADLHDLLPRCVPLGIALEMAITADPVTAEAALRWGLVNRVVEDHDLVAEALALAEMISSLGPLAMRSVRASIARGLDLVLEEALGQEASSFGEILATGDAGTGLGAFSERLEPDYSGR